MVADLSIAETWWSRMIVTELLASSRKRLPKTDSPQEILYSLLIRLLYCSRFCSGLASKLHRGSTEFNKLPATNATAITWNHRISTDFNKHRNLVRDQGVGGSNPLSPINYFQ
jgi:hypothetical protein